VAAKCPRCGAPLYRLVPPGRERRAVPGPASPQRGAPPKDAPPREGGLLTEDPAPSEARSVTTSPLSVFAVVGAVFVVILVLLSQGAPDPGSSRVDSSPVPRGGPTGILVYAMAEGGGSARLWRWDLVSGEVRKGPLIPHPVELVNVRSPSFGWLGITSDRGRGVFEASVLDSLEVGAEPERLGRGTIVTWARQGETALLVDRGPPSDGCRRTVSVSAAHVDRPRLERVLRGTLCGDVLSVGRTSIGHYLTRLGPGGADVIGVGYSDAGVLLPDHGLIAVSPSGEMIVTPSADLRSTGTATAEDGTGRRVPLIRVTGRASLYAQFRGPPVPYLVGGVPLRVDRVLAFGPGASVALVVGRVGDDRPGLWELPLLASGDGSIRPRKVGSDGGYTFAAYADDGTAYVATGGWLYILRDHVLKLLLAPEGAPTPAGPLVWIVQEPTADL
jgi:hypothetical protein